ncbi:Fatty acyl-CoA reductase [Cynara cardunculus var. scolymus]|uniref:Fatty acyl-CoA reductase n=1 Tax=Cynara cardunculus var. scolymus TaxID=59895 RepID=A0A118K2E5_CYNCS|nr:Fatty acyl-CoA reductase [Cynara cardunculus var. scolymus]
MNTEKLRRAVRESGEEDNMFYFDPRIIDWDEYFQHIHLPAIQPNIKKLFLLVRASDPNMALHRLQSEVINKDLFRVIKEKYGKNMHTFISQKIKVVAGDVSLENFGVMDFDLLNEMRRQVDVIVNSAATTKFDERYDLALAINTLGSKHVSDFVNECFNMKLLLHVSTGLNL